MLAAQEYIKYVVFVDEDVDVNDEAAVLWAIATRATLSADLTLTRAVRGTEMDPTARGREGAERGVIDATAKDPAMLANRVRVKQDVLANLRVDDYVTVA